MSTPREDFDAAIRTQARQARQLAAQLDSRGRALLVAEVIRGVYDAVKFDAPEGGGLDGRDGPERSSLGRLSDAAMNYATEVAKAGFAQDRSITTRWAIPTSSPCSSRRPDSRLLLRPGWAGTPNPIPGRRPRCSGQ